MLRTTIPQKAKKAKSKSPKTTRSLKRHIATYKPKGTRPSLITHETPIQTTKRKFFSKLFSFGSKDTQTQLPVQDPKDYVLGRRKDHAAMDLVTILSPILPELQSGYDLNQLRANKLTIDQVVFSDICQTDDPSSLSPRDIIQRTLKYIQQSTIHEQLLNPRLTVPPKLQSKGDINFAFLAHLFDIQPKTILSAKYLTMMKFLPPLEVFPVVDNTLMLSPLSPEQVEKNENTSTINPFIQTSKNTMKINRIDTWDDVYDVLEALVEGIVFRRNSNDVKTTTKSKRDFARILDGNVDSDHENSDGDNDGEEIHDPEADKIPLCVGVLQNLGWSIVRRGLLNGEFNNVVDDYDEDYSQFEEDKEQPLDGDVVDNNDDSKTKTTNESPTISTLETPKDLLPGPSIESIVTTLLYLRPTLATPERNQVDAILSRSSIDDFQLELITKTLSMSKFTFFDRDRGKFVFKGKDENGLTPDKNLNLMTYRLTPFTLFNRMSKGGLDPTNGYRCLVGFPVIRDVKEWKGDVKMDEQRNTMELMTLLGRDEANFFQQNMTSRTQSIQTNNNDNDAIAHDIEKRILDASNFYEYLTTVPENEQIEKRTEMIAKVAKLY